MVSTINSYIEYTPTILRTIYIIYIVSIYNLLLKFYMNTGYCEVSHDSDNRQYFEGQIYPGPGVYVLILDPLHKYIFLSRQVQLRSRIRA
jgi:hypothetical protein